MKKYTAYLGLIVVLLGGGCFEKPIGTSGTGNETLLRYHFVGFTELGRTTNNAKLQQVGALPASAMLRQEMARKLAKAAAQYWRKDPAVNAGDQAALWQPLFDDLLAAESAARLRGGAGHPELVVAAAVNEGRARLWSTNLWQLAHAWKLGTPRPLAVAGGSGWEVAQPGAVVQFAQIGSWVVAGTGSDPAGVLAPVLKEIASGAPPLAGAKNLLFEIEVDFPRLTKVFPGLARYRLPRSYLSMTNRGDSIRSEARMTFSEKIPWTYEPWKIPTNIITEPINSFTVAQGIAPLWPQLKGVGGLGLKSYPNQLCAWGQNYEPGSTAIAMPVPNATETMHQLSKGLPNFINEWFNEALGEFYYVSNRAEFFWRAIPFIAPFLRTATNSGIEYLHFATLPTPRNEPPPPQMFAAIANRTNLIYWDFEITGQRVLTGLELYQMADIVTHRAIVSTNLPTQYWLTSIARLAGETVTEATLTSPREISLIRKSHLGFTGFELATLMHWLESPGFPFRFESSTARLATVKQGATANPAAVTNTFSPKKP